MPRSTTRRIIKKKKQPKKHIKRQVKSNQQNNQQKTQQLNQQIKTPSLLPAGFSHQQYGNPDLAIQQLRNQTQTFNDQIFNYQATIKSMEKEKTEKERNLAYLKKNYKDAKMRLKQVKNDFDIAKDNQTDIEIYNKKADYLIHRTNSLDKLSIQTKRDIDINKMTKKEIAVDHEIMMKQLHLERQNKDIEKRKKTFKLEEKEAELNQLRAECEAADKYVESPAFKEPETTLQQLLTEHMQEEEKKRFLNEIQKNAEEIKHLRTIIEEDPKDHAVIMEYYAKKVAAQERLIGKAKHHKELLEDKNNDIQYLRKKNQELRNKANDERIDNEIVDEKLSYYRKEDLINNNNNIIKEDINLNTQIEDKKEELNTMKAIKKKKKENQELAEEIEELDRSTKDDKFKQQNERMVELETQLEDENIESAKLNQIKSEQKHLDQMQLSNEARGRAISSSILQGQNYDEAPVINQVNNMIDYDSCACSEPLRGSQQNLLIENNSSNSFHGDQLSRSPNPYYKGSNNNNFEEEEED